MDLTKIGKLLQELRKEKGLTQEQLAEQMGVARRTVSRWETGSNMPDLDVLVELSDFYAVDLRELLNGERKSEQMDQELKQTILQASDYEGKVSLLRRIRGRTLRLLIAGLLLAVVCLWRFWPHSFTQILPQAEPESLEKIWASATRTTIESGNMQMNSYTATFSKGDEGWSEILWLLESAAYRKDLRNPIYPLMNGFSVSGADKSVVIILQWGAALDKTCLIHVMSGNLITVSSGDGKSSCIYHPSNHTIQDKLADYIQKNGEIVK